MASQVIMNEIQKELGLVQKIMPESQTCWAASIAMILDLNDDSQNELVDFVRSHSGGTTMPPNEEYYIKLFREFNMGGCTQIQSVVFPTTTFIKEKIEYNQPFIFSGILLPTMATTPHVFVVQGYATKEQSNIFLLLCLDPYNDQLTLKTIWVYAEIIRYNLDDSKKDFITDFQTQGIHFDGEDFENEELYSNYYEILPSGIHNFTKKLVKNWKKTIERYFDFNGNNFRFSLDYTSLPISAKQIIETNNWITDNAESILLVLRIEDNKNKIIEILFREVNRGKVFFLGIREPLFKLINEPIFDEVLQQMNHEEKRYNILTISELNYSFYMILLDEYEQEFLLSPIENYKGLESGIIYSKSEIRNYLIENLNN
jgi:hypothetical protein